MTPGAPFHIVGSPQFERAVLHGDGRRPITVEAPGAGLLSPYVQSATLNGAPLTRAWFFERDLTRKGGTLRLEMGSEPNTTWATSPAARPPSASTAKLSEFGC